MKAILYAAKSTEDVHGSIETQLADCRALAEREGWGVVEDYQDEAASAYKGNRGPGLAAALDCVERIGGTLIVQHSDRLARGDGKRAQHLVEICLRAINGDFKLQSVQDPATFDNLVMAVVMGERNTEDSRRKSAATQSGKRRAWERGDFPGGPTPDGWVAISRKPTKVRLDPDRIKIIRLVGELSDQGWGDPSIARELNRRGLQTQGGSAWRRRRIQDLLTNALYYGGVMWHRDDPDREINWDTSFPTPWTREDFERRMRARPGTDGHRSTGRPHTNHALAGLAVCAYCMRQGRRSVMRPITSSYRRKNGTRQRTYVCGHVQDFTGLCHAPRIDAELVDTHVINGLQRYLGDFEAWLEQLLSGYASERHRLGRDLRNALRNCEEQERICERIDRAIGLAETDAEAKAAMRAAGAAHEELERRQRRSRAAQDALDGVPQRSTGRCHARLLQRAERRDPRQTGGGRHTRPG
jgi:DNA invertase Pin-like site-specific DNA recombinase